jgi:hypothetical protein
MPDLIKWKPIDESRYWEMLGMLPPAAQTGIGFLLGEPYSHRLCTVTGNGAATFSAFAEHAGAFFEAARPLTVAEFRRVTAADIAANPAS